MKKIIALTVLYSLCFSVLDAQVSYERIANAENEPSGWFTYSGNYHSTRYSSLSQINKNNVQKLAPVWVYQLKNPGTFETTPIVADKVMYISEPPSTVTAIDIATGRSIWSYTPNIPKDVKFPGYGPLNRVWLF